MHDDRDMHDLLDERVQLRSLREQRPWVRVVQHDDVRVFDVCSERELRHTRRRVQLRDVQPGVQTEHSVADRVHE
jgi:hypothetical protein